MTRGLRSLIRKQRASYELYKLNTERYLDFCGSALKRPGRPWACSTYTPPLTALSGVESVSPGIELDPGTPLMTLSRSDSLVLYSNTAADMFMYNKQVDISVKAGDDTRTTTGRVVSSSRLLPGYFGTFVYIKPEDPAIIGSAAEAKASCEYMLLKDALLIPRSGVDTDKGRSFVTILDGNTVRKRYIIAGPQLPRETAVFQGVNPGDLIVTSQFTS